MRQALLAIALACSSNALQNAECRVGCLWAGYDSGCFLEAQGCACIDLRSYEALTQEKRLRIPARRKPAPEGTKKQSSLSE